VFNLNCFRLRIADRSNFKKLNKPETGGTMFFLSRPSRRTNNVSHPVPCPAKKSFLHPVPSRVRNKESRPVSHEKSSYHIKINHQFLLKTCLSPGLLFSSLKSKILIHFYMQPARKNLSNIAGEKRTILYSGTLKKIHLE
jgi:hypothetical protein